MAATATWANAAAPAPKECTLKQYASLDVQLRDDGAIVVPVDIGGHAERMVFNAASAFSTIRQADATRLGLKQQVLPGNMPVVRLGPTPIKRTASTAGFALGTLRFERMEFLVVPPSETGASVQAGPDIGFLGMDLFRNIDVEIDLAHNKINLFAPEHCRDAAVYWADSYDAVPVARGPLQDPYFVMELDGKKLQTKLATGDAESMLYTDVTRKLYDWDENSPGVESETDPDGHAVSRYRAMAITASGLKVVNASIRLQPGAQRPCANMSWITFDNHGAAGFEGCMGIYPLKIGTNVLKRLRVYIAAKENMMYFTAADAHR
jgi:hypothetical protein